MARVGVEIRHDRLLYHFENPSSFDTSVTVPHFFEQRYDADNTWLIGSVRYRVAGIVMETSGGATPERAAIADDYDTFFNPGGVVIVAGTTGPATMRAWRAAQLVEIGRVGDFQVLAGYRFRQDNATFGVGHKTVIRNGVLIDTADVTTREMARSREHSFVFAVDGDWRIGGAWRLRLGGDLAPLLAGWLRIQLPDKYPGVDLVFTARTAAGSGRIAIERSIGRWSVGAGGDVSETWSYSDSARLEHHARGAQISFGRSW